MKDEVKYAEVKYVEPNDDTDQILRILEIQLEILKELTKDWKARECTSQQA